MSPKSRLTAPRRKSPWGTLAKYRFGAALTLALACNVNAESINLIFAGDIMLDDGPGRFIGQSGDPLAPFAAILEAAESATSNARLPKAAAPWTTS